jgi:hypothetical protein
MPQVEVISEREQGRGWEFTIQVLDDRGTLRRYVVTLSWADYNLWSRDGGDEPARVAEAVMLFCTSQVPAAELNDKFDASIARRQFEDADAKIPLHIRRT